MVIAACAVPSAMRRGSDVPVRLLCPGAGGISRMVARREASAWAGASALPRFTRGRVADCDEDVAPRRARCTAVQRPGSRRHGHRAVPIEHTTPVQEGVPA